MRVWILLWASVCAGIAAEGIAPRNAVLVELFTSEGCSDCPPADTLLEKLDKTQPLTGAQIIVLSEHVDYWNHLGWSDPYSSAQFSRRQERYALRFRISGPYTPQMVIDGAAELVGSDSRAALSAIGSAAKAGKATVRISRAGLKVRIEIEPAPDSATHHEAGVYFAIADNSGASSVLRGENKGRNLRHIAIVRRLEQVGKWDGRTQFMKEVPAGPAGTRTIAFLQEPGNGRVLGAAILADSQ